MNRPGLVFGAGILAVACGAAALRLPRLAERPMHGDEANQAYKAGLELYENGVYVYNVRDHHGPSLYYLTQPVLWLSGARGFAETTESEYRLVPVLFGLGLILLLIPLRDGLGRPATVCAAALTALSPAMVFYSRYYIQETLLLFFTLATLVTVWRYTRTGRAGWLLLAGASVGLMHATKETWVIHAAAMGAGAALAWLWAWLWTRWREGAPAPAATVRPRFKASHVAGAVAVAAAVVVLFYASPTFQERPGGHSSACLANPMGPIDSIRAYRNYFVRAGGAGLHDHPWYWYLGMLAYSRDGEWPGWARIWDIVSRGRLSAGLNWSEGLIVGLAIVGLVAALRHKTPDDAHGPLLRFLAFYTLLLVVLYSAIPYKTPWCVLAMLHGMILLAGVGVVALVRWIPLKALQVVAVLVIAALAAQLGEQAWRASYRSCADNRNPYVYAHTSTDCLNLVKRVEALARVSPKGRDLVIRAVARGDYWPLPWYLRKFRNVDWSDSAEGADGDIVIVSPETEGAVDAHLHGRYDKRSVFGLRPGVLVSMYVEESLWQAFERRQGGAP